MVKNLVMKLRETEGYIRRRTDIVPRIGLILGSGLGNLAESSSEDVIFDYSALPYFFPSTVPGHAGRLIFGNLCEQPIMVMQGRFHFYEGYSMEQITYPIRLMKLLGVEYLIITSAVGGMRPEYRPGDIVILKDYINMMGQNCLRGAYWQEFGERFPDMSEIFKKDLRKMGMAAAKKNKIRAYEGVYVAVSGPSYETPAEISAFKRIGGDVVGMSVVPETTVANQMGIKVLGITYVSNLASGISKMPLSHSEVMKVGKSACQKVGKLITGVVEQISKTR